MDGSNASAQDETGDEAEIAAPWAAHRGLLAAVIGMGVAIVTGLAVVVYGLVYSMSEGEESAPAISPVLAQEPYLRQLDFGAGPGGLRSFAVGDLLAIAGTAEAGAPVIVLIEPRTGREVGRIRLAAPAPDPP